MLVLALPPFLAERAAAPIEKRTAPPAPLRIDVNEAAWFEWMLLDGVGEARARRIAAYVREHRPIRAPEELRSIGGLPSGWIERAMPYLDFGGVVPPKG
jgi:DNA uptake protein ComE-like DNA-binding protein